MKRDKIKNYTIRIRQSESRDNIKLSINVELIDDLRTAVFDRLGLIVNNSQLVDYLVFKGIEELKKTTTVNRPINEVVNLSNNKKPKKRLINHQLDPEYADDDVV